MAKYLLVADVEGWAWHNRCLGIQRYAPPEHQVDVTIQQHYSESDYNQYDVVLMCSWTQCKDRGQSNVLTMVANEGCRHDYSPGSLPLQTRTASSLKNRTTAVARLPTFAGIVCINPRCIEYCRTLNPNTVYLQTGVDTEFWAPGAEHRQAHWPFVVGWTGKPSTKTKWSPKGYGEVWIPLRKQLHNAGISCVENTRTSTNALTPAQMRDWYHSLDLLCITSCSEGTPSIALEAMSCGTPVVATNVGVLQGALTHAIERDCHSCISVVRCYGDAIQADIATRELLTAITKMAATFRAPERYQRACWCARHIMVEHWSWRQLAPVWLSAMLRMVRQPTREPHELA